MAKWSRYLRGPTRRTGEPGVGSGGGDPPGGGGSGSPPAPAPAGAGGTGGGSGPPSGGGDVPRISVDVLPEGLRNLPESQIRFQLSQLATALTSTNARNRQLEEELKKRKDPPAPPRPEPREPAAPKKPLGDRLLEEPEAALEEFFTSRASPVLERLDRISDQLDKTSFTAARTSFPDFEEYEEQVVELLGNNPKTEENIAGAYTMAIGLRTLEERERRRREANNSERAVGGGDGTPPAKQYPKSALSEEIRVGLGMSEDEYYDKYSQPIKVKVPT